MPGSPALAAGFFQAIPSLLSKGVIVRVPPLQRFRGFYSNLFVVPKKDGSVRPILDLKRLNRYVRLSHFRMESLRSVIASLEPGEFLSSVDIQDAYLHVPIYPPHQRFLRFAVGEEHYQFVALPFGLASAPRVFTKTMAAVMALLRARGVSVTPYLDDILVKAPSRDQNLESLHITLDTLSRFGWLLNRPKSSLVPAQSIVFLGMRLDSVQARVFLPEDKLQSLQANIRALCSHRPVSIRSCMRVLGKMVASMEAIPFAQFHSRPLQLFLLSRWDRSLPSLDRRVKLPARLRQDLQWWLRSPSLSLGRSFLPVHWQIVTTDASLRGWGGVWNDLTVQGTWSAKEACLPINILELRAIRLSLLHWQTQLHGLPVRVQTDNATAVAYVNHQGGTRSKAAMMEVALILSWAEETVLALGMDPASRGVLPDLSQVGDTGCGSDGVSLQPQTAEVRLPDEGPAGSGLGRLGDSLASVQPPLHLSSSPASAAGGEKDKVGRTSGNPRGPGLATARLVHGSREPRRRRPLASTRPTGSSHSRSALPPAFSHATFDGVAVETWILKSRGFSDAVIRTMIRARKPSSARIYYRCWKAFLRHCEACSAPPLPFSLAQLLAFLQAGLDAGLALSSLKGQVSALSVFFQRPLASVPQVRTFLQGVARIAPPYRHPVPPWDLNLVLDAMQSPPFEPLQEVPLAILSFKVAFLVAVTSVRRISELAALSCRPPLLVLHQDKAVLRPVASFQPKVVSPFHLNEDIVLPSFCPAPSHPRERALHKLDVVRALRIYLSRTKSLRHSDSLFVIPEGPRKGSAASKATLARWVRSAIAQAYRSKGKSPPFRIAAHSTRSVGASWAIRHGASALQLCKAATWSSLHTFSRFYRVDTFASADASLGRLVLQAAVASSSS
ncbi:uncharacterized protein [Dendropsophus ebraccatus]|uniref:uncharacterized protein n=1 Tax=Dendropsophus ebraccatus TaxID=150705 RepID=UPI003831264F